MCIMHALHNFRGVVGLRAVNEVAGVWRGLQQHGWLMFRSLQGSCVFILGPGGSKCGLIYPDAGIRPFGRVLAAFC